MTLWLPIIWPLLGGSLLWFLGEWVAIAPHPRRGLLGSLAALVMVIELLLAVAAIGHNEKSFFAWGGGIGLSLQVVPMVKIALVLVPFIALPVLLWAAAMEDDAGLPRLLGLLIGFTGAMEMLIIAADLLVVAIAWELLGVFSWALIAHHWQDDIKVAAANYAFNATRIGGLGLWFAAGAALAVGGNFDFSTLSSLGNSYWGHLMAAGIIIAAASKSGQGPFAPWLFKAMEGPSSVSALLHSSTMVAAGAWLLIRLHEPLSTISWFGPVAIALGLATALAGGLTAIVQVDAKRLLAASTSAQYGLMIAAVGAGYAAAGLVHLVTHAAFKALLFLAAGSVISAAGTHSLFKMREMGLGRRLPIIATAAWVGTLALAAIPPLGAAWSKEKLVAAAGHISPWLALTTIAAGTLSAWYALRLQAMAFSYGQNGVRNKQPLMQQLGLWLLAAGCILLGLLWLTGDNNVLVSLLPGNLPHGQDWELLVSIALALITAVGAWFYYRRPHQTGSKEAAEEQSSNTFIVDWWGMSRLIEMLLVRPVEKLAAFCAAFDRKVVDAGVRGAVLVAGWFSRCLGGMVEPQFKEYVRRLAVNSLNFGDRSGGVEQALDAGLAALTKNTLWLAKIFRSFIERAVDRLVNGFGTAAGSAGNISRKSQTGSLPTYFAFLIGGFFLFFLTFFFRI